jgi:UDP-glucuronate decarboxylase
MDGTAQQGPATPASALVTGGAGFLGSHLCRRLLEEGHAVVAVDNLATGLVRNLEPLLDDPRFTFFRHDVVQPLDLPVSRIYNLACCASPVHYQADPVKTMRTCVDGALNVLKLAQRHGVPVLQASTSEIYGEPEVHPQQEDYRGSVSTIGPRACYDEGKRCAETLFFDYRRTHGTAIKIARIFNTYGPHMQAGDGRVVSNLIVQALRDEPMTLNGDGSQTRSFCYVDDLIDGLVRLMDSPHEVTGPINLGNPHEVTVLELAERIIDITGTRSRLVRKPMPVDDPTRRCPDITRAREQLAWAPRVGLDEGLRRTVAWFEDVLSTEAGVALEMEVRNGA